MSLGIKSVATVTATLLPTVDVDIVIERLEISSVFRENFLSASCYCLPFIFLVWMRRMTCECECRNDNDNNGGDERRR